MYEYRDSNSSPYEEERRKFPRSLRLKKKREFERVYKNGRRYWNKTFVIYILPNGINVTRLGLTVSKKVGKSVKRNRVKRLIRESFRLSQEQIMPGYDIVVVAQPRACGLKCQQAQSELLSLFRRGRILKTSFEALQANE
ncbi:TPA: ribonuclease P protein component [Candidatus Poribacteria bacterium]|nr:ribonuclease P protein component [Candidatus Poribacteria bacterium]